MELPIKICCIIIGSISLIINLLSFDINIILSLMVLLKMPNISKPIKTIFRLSLVSDSLGILFWNNYQQHLLSITNQDQEDMLKSKPLLTVVEYLRTINLLLKCIVSFLFLLN